MDIGFEFINIIIVRKGSGKNYKLRKKRKKKYHQYTYRPEHICLIGNQQYSRHYHHHRPHYHQHHYCHCKLNKRKKSVEITIKIGEF